MNPSPCFKWTRLAASCIALLLASGCSSMRTDTLPNADSLRLSDENGAMPELEYRIRPGDDLDVKFFYTRELNESPKVRPDGFITLQLVDDVRAAGLTPKELKDALVDRYAGHLKQPVVSVIVRSFTSFRAYIGGEVAVPQLVPLEGGLTPIQAIARAGGVRTSANLQTVVLIRKGAQGQPIPYQLDLSDDALAAGRRDARIALLPSDVLYVPRSRIANANLFVQQYISDLLLFRGVQLGFSTNYIHNRDKADVTTLP